jgi:hypothetical protein
MEVKLVSHLGFARADETWVTAWSMPAYSHGRRWLVNALCVGLPLAFLAVDGFDWSETFRAVATEVGGGGEWGGEVVRIVGLYLLRHVYMYYGLTRWIVQWDKRLFEVGAKGEAAL